MNLERALRSMRHQDGSTNLILWVDAISINQEDLQERSIQVAQMCSIYRNARVFEYGWGRGCDFCDSGGGDGDSVQRSLNPLARFEQ